MSYTWEAIKARRGSPENTPEYQAEARAIALGRLVRRLREQDGLTQSQLAQRMGTTQPNVARLERGATVPTVETLERVANALEGHLVVGVVTDDELAQAPQDHRRETQGQVLMASMDHVVVR